MGRSAGHSLGDLAAKEAREVERAVLPNPQDAMQGQRNCYHPREEPLVPHDQKAILQIETHHDTMTVESCHGRGCAF